MFSSESWASLMPAIGLLLLHGSFKHLTVAVPSLNIWDSDVVKEMNSVDVDANRINIWSITLFVKGMCEFNPI
jgi:hypothetical protein